MKDEISQIQTKALEEMEAAGDLQQLEQVRVAVLGSSGSLTSLGPKMRDVPKEEKPAIGKALNAARTAITEAYETRKTTLEQAKDEEALQGIDITLPGTAPSLGGLHPIIILQHRALAIFRRMGFALLNGPDVESEWRCFDALNTPKDHPARNEKDTFYFEDGRLLRTHTSTTQILAMENREPPLRIVAPGLAFRRDEVDATHSFQFTQMEGLYVDTDVSLAELKGALEFFVHELFGPDTPTRFRPHFFPFTEPSFELDVQLATGSGEPKWVEMLGCGMVDPAVFEAVNKQRGDNAYDPEKYTGYAFGLGLDRLAMSLWKIPDIRYFAENDLRFLRQFS